MGAYLVLPADYLQTGQIRYVSRKSLPEQLRSDISRFLVAGMVAEHPDNLHLQRTVDPLALKIHLLGEEEELSEDAAILRFVLPLLLGFVVVFNVTISAQFLMSSVVDERENHIMEILLTSLRPIELIGGKVLGLGGLALFQLVFWASLGVGAGIITGRMDAVQEARFEPSLFILVLAYTVLYFFLFAGIMVGVGAVAAAEQEARQLASIFILLALLPPSWGMAIIVENPSSPLAIGLSLFPLTAPTTMMTLIALDATPLWLILASLTLMFFSLLGVTWISAKLFRAGMLHTGQRMSWRTIRQVIWESGT